jgi:hypothetical protein
LVESNQVAQIAQRKEKSQDESTSDIREQKVAKQVLSAASNTQNGVLDEVLPGAELAWLNQVAQIAQRKEKSQDESTSDIREQEVAKQVLSHCCLTTRLL